MRNIYTNQRPLPGTLDTEVVGNATKEIVAEAYMDLPPPTMKEDGHRYAAFLRNQLSKAFGLFLTHYLHDGERGEYMDVIQSDDWEKKEEWCAEVISDKRGMERANEALRIVRSEIQSCMNDDFHAFMQNYASQN